MTNINDGTPNPVVLSGTTTPFTAITVDDPPLVQENVSITLFPNYISSFYANGLLSSSYVANSNTTDVGYISDPNGGGHWDAATHTFTESVAASGMPTGGTQLIQRLHYIPPVLGAGYSDFVSVMISVNGVADLGGIMPAIPSTGYSSVATPYGAVLLEIVTPPAIAGTRQNNPVPSPTPSIPTTSVKPFETVQIMDGNFSGNAQLTATITVTDNGVVTDADGVLKGNVSKSGTGSYTLTGTPGQVQGYLNGLDFLPTATGADRTTSFELSVTDIGFQGLTTDDKNTSVLVIGSGQTVGTNPPAGGTNPPAGGTNPPAGGANPPAGGANPPGGAGGNQQPVNFAVSDLSSNQTTTTAGDAYSGPVPGVIRELVQVTPDNLNVTSFIPNVFIHTGSGTDAIDVSKANGNNVLDGATNSNFLVGGGGTDTFFVDDRNAAADIWDTVSNFHAGDAATIWGVTPSDFGLGWADGQGAGGYTGLTLHATAAGKPTASLTLAGYTTANLSDGKLSITYGTDAGSGSPFMYIQAH
jgi:hypothetical protein